MGRGWRPTWAGTSLGVGLASTVKSAARPLSRTHRHIEAESNRPRNPGLLGFGERGLGQALANSLALFAEGNGDGLLGVLHNRAIFTAAVKIAHFVFVHRSLDARHLLADL